MATVGADGTPHVVPVGWSYNAEVDAIEIRGHELAGTKKWRARGVEVRGVAEAVEEPEPLIRVRPERIVSWGVDARGRHSRDA